MQHDHHGEVAEAVLDAAAREQVLGVPPGHDQLREPLAGDHAQQQPVDDHAVYHRSRTSSALTPGPRPIMRPGDPAGGRSVSPIISRMCSTDAEDILPTWAGER